MTIEDFVSKLPLFSTGVLSTSVNDKTDARGWQLQYYEDGRFYFITTKTKSVYKQLQANPYATFYTMSADEEFRISGKVFFVEDEEEKKDSFLKMSPMVQKQYKSHDNRLLVFFYIAEGGATLSDNTQLLEKVSF